MRVFLLLALSGIAAFAQTKQELGKRAIDEALAALGGDRFLSMQDRVETGRAYSFYREELSGLSIATIYTRYLKRAEPPEPGQLLISERQSFGKEERYGAVLFADGKGHEITFRGARPVPQDTLDRFRDSTLHNIFYILRQRLDEPGLIIEHQGTDFVDNMPVEIVSITDADNRTVTVYLNRSTHLPVRQLYVRRDPKTRERFEEVTIYSKYRDVGGIQWPYDVQRLRNGRKIFEMYADSVEVNKGLPDELFTLPANIKILKPAR
ncbi:MAG TPA: hypothetical protein PLA43_13990 [Bryobacteraceae bacterium]|nr:hypothetical protein [Bryobacteraceae bacterium]HOL73108.1 hypothetical protein [Bryobacteraceae bacterium]HOQ47010.1 hypothetical protein [Bryobacteraceae bacterium]HPQ15817.1 hypothetical protein [Bryobacteraceae bacterium]HPU73063.1 hypothetical protein [Bryobacteraceae bacterium]